MNGFRLSIMSRAFVLAAAVVAAGACVLLLSSVASAATVRAAH